MEHFSFFTELLFELLMEFFNISINHIWVVLPLYVLFVSSIVLFVLKRFLIAHYGK